MLLLFYQCVTDIFSRKRARVLKDLFDLLDPFFSSTLPYSLCFSHRIPISSSQSGHRLVKEMFTTPSPPATTLLTFVFSSHLVLSFNIFSYKHIKLSQKLEVVHSASLTCVLAISPWCATATYLLVLSSSAWLLPVLFFSELERKQQWTWYWGSSWRIIILRTADSPPEREEQLISLLEW